MRHGRHNSGVPAPIDLASVSDVQPFPEDDAARMAADPANASRARSRRAAVRGASSPQRSPAWQALGICAELLITAAVICALYIVWQMWWTGVEAERAQNETTQSVDWSDPSNNGGTVTIAKAQEGDAPVQPKDAKYGDLIAQIYIPRFGSQWHRNIVEGTTLEQLNRHGLGHYDTTQMPGQVGQLRRRRPPATATGSRWAMWTSCRKAIPSSFVPRITGTSTTTPGTRLCCPRTCM